MLAPDLRHLRRCQAGNPLIGLSEFPEPPLSVVVSLPGPPAWIGQVVRTRVERAGPHSVWGTKVSV